MAAGTTVYKVELQVSDMDRNYYAGHSLVLARHPSETEARLMVRLIAFALFAHERLEFGRGISEDDEPALWHRDYTGEIEHWIELGQPDESRVRKACGRAREVSLITYSGNSAGIWWGKQGELLGKLGNLQVLDLDAAQVEAATRLLGRNLQLSAMVQDGELQLLAGDETVTVIPQVRKARSAR